MPHSAHFLPLVVWLAAIAGALAQDQASDVPPANPLAGVEPLAAAARRSEADEDRVNFTAHLLQARLAQGRGEKDQALRHYQRAWRYAPDQTPLLREIVALAFALKRNSEAIRYATLAAEAEASDPILLRRLALLATSRREWPEAAALFESSERLDARARRPGDKLDQAALAVKLEMGRIYFLAEQYEKSAATFAVVRQALADPAVALTDTERQTLLDKPAQTYALWAEAFLVAGKLDDAEALFRQANDAQADAANLAFQLARVEAARGNPASARRELEEYFAAKSSAAGMEPYTLFAEMVAQQQPDAMQARKSIIDRFEKRLMQDPENQPLKLSLAKQYLAANQLDKAEPLLVAIVAGGASGEAFRELIEIYRRQSKLDKLLSVAAAAVNATGSLEVLGEAGIKVANSAGTMQKLVENIRTRRRLRPQSLARGELFAAGLFALESRQYSAADELLAAAASAADAEAGSGAGAILLRWGLGMMLANQYPRAARAFQQIIDRQPAEGDELALAHFYLAGASELAGKTDEALAAARRGANLQPDNPRLASREAWILYHAKRVDAAKAAYSRFVGEFDQRPEDGETREAVREARLVLSNLEMQAGDLAAAGEWLEQVLDEYPHDAGASNDLGYLWADHNVHLHRAKRLIEFAVAEQPKNAAYRDSLGWAFFRQGEFAAAAAELEKAAASERADGVILEHWGDALHKLGRLTEARAAWQRAEAAFQKEQAADKLKRVREKIKEPKNQSTEEPKQ